jgi:hypothetical protein
MYVACSLLFDSTLVNTSLDTAVPAIESTGSDAKRYSQVASNTETRRCHAPFTYMYVCIHTVQTNKQTNTTIKTVEPMD